MVGRLALVLVLVVQMALPARATVICDPNLVDEYVWNNKRYFGGKLPLIDVVYDDTLDADGYWGYVNCRIFEKKPTTLRMNAKLQNTSEMGTIRGIYLLHEMTHVAQCMEGSTDFHGPDFQRRMHKLAQQGAFEPYW